MTSGTTPDAPVQVYTNPHRLPVPPAVPGGAAIASSTASSPATRSRRSSPRRRWRRSWGWTALWVKVESSRFGLPSFKVSARRGRSPACVVDRFGTVPDPPTLDDLRAAVATGAPITFVAATDGNHGRAVARMARLLGCACRILVPAGTATARITGIESRGATVDVIEGTYDDAVAASAALADDDVLVVSDTSWDGYADVPTHVIEGYTTIFAEVDEQLGDDTLGPGRACRWVSVR